MKRRCLLALLALLGLAACADPARVTTASVGPRFQLVAVEPLTPDAGPPAGAVTPDPVYGPATLTVNLVGVVPSLRRVLATMADVDQVVVTVRMEDGSGVEVRKTVERAALDAGQTTVTFTGLPEGRATVLIEALDAAQQVIGARKFSAQMVADVPAHLDVALPLTSIDRTSGGGSSGGGAAPAATPVPAAAGLIADVTIADSAVIDGVAPGTVLRSFGGFEALGSVHVTAGGELWAMAKEASGYSAVRFGVDGAVVQRVSGGDAVGISGQGFGVDSRGHLWMIDGAAKKLSHFDASGSLVGSVPLTRGGALAIDGDDQVWVTDVQEVLQVSPLGAVVARHAVGGWGRGLTLDPATGSLYVALQLPSTAGELLKLSPTGAVEWRHLALGWRHHLDQPALDADGHLWLPLHHVQQLIRMAPDGTVVTRYDLPARPRLVRMSADGTLWVGTEASLLKVSATGEVLGEFRGAGGPVSVAFDAQGLLWAAHGGQLSQVSP